MLLNSKGDSSYPSRSLFGGCTLLAPYLLLPRFYSRKWFDPSYSHKMSLIYGCFKNTSRAKPNQFRNECRRTKNKNNNRNNNRTMASRTKIAPEPNNEISLHSNPKEGLPIHSSGGSSERAKSCPSLRLGKEGAEEK